MWLLPISILVATTFLAVPLSRYLAWLMNGKYRAPSFLRWFESKLNSGPQNWKQYTASLLIFNTVLFVFGFAVLALQPLHAAEQPESRDAGAIEYLSHRRLVYDEYGCATLFRRPTLFEFHPIILLLLAILFVGVDWLLQFDGDHPVVSRRRNVGNFFVDMWRVVAYMFLPISLLMGVVCLQQGSP